MFILDGSKYGIHHPLKGCWGVRQSKEHDVRDVYSKFSFKCGFVFVFFPDPYVIVSLTYVEFRKDASVLHRSDGRWYKREGIVVSDR